MAGLITGEAVVLWLGGWVVGWLDGCGWVAGWMDGLISVLCVAIGCAFIICTLRTL